MTTYTEFLVAARSFTVTDEMTRELGLALNVKRHAHWTQSTYYTKVLAAVEAAHAAQVDAHMKALAEQDRKDAMARRAAERADVTAWLALNSRNYDVPDYRFAVAVRRAQASLENFAKELNDFTTRLAQDPLYALSWSGSFCEATADNAVSKWVLEGFAMGATLDDMVAESLRETLRAAKNGSSRSTSTMSNLMDDVTGMAWAKAYERLSGQSAW